MIAVSYLKSKEDKKTTIKKINESNASFIHVDLMDGEYVSEKNFTIEEVIDDLKDTTKLLDIHLMTKNPLNYIKELVKLNVWCFTFHLDSTFEIDETIKFIKDNHIKVGIAISPNDDISIIDRYIGLIDYVLIMSVTPGMGGQEFIPEVLDKVRYLENKKVLVGIDGGINKDTIKYLKDYKIDNIISGSYICMSDDYNIAIESLK